MQLQIIENDHIAFVQARCQLCFDIAFKGVAVHGAVDDPGRDEFMTAQACDEGLGLPFAKRWSLLIIAYFQMEYCETIHVR